MRKLIMTLAAIAIAAPAFALSLDEAKSKGYVGEREDGYLGVVQDADGVSALVKDINNKRRAQYQATSSSNGAPLSAVEALAGKTAYERTPSGQYVRGANGQWMKK